MISETFGLGRAGGNRAAVVSSASEEDRWHHCYLESMRSDEGRSLMGDDV